MSKHDFSSNKIPDVEYSKFKQWLLDKALEETSSHLFTSRYANVGLSLTYLLEVYEAGQERRIPEAWVPLYEQMKQEQSQEYKTYLTLHEKYGQKRKVFDITIEKSFNGDKERNSEEKNSLNQPKGNNVAPAKRRDGRQIKKDGDIHSFN